MVDAPRTQYDRNLTIRIVGGGPLVSLTFPIKPKELQRDTPARISTTQTLQGVYQDMGGLGVTTLVYQGHTGWRRRSPDGLFDGFETFQRLYKNIYEEYHRRIENTGSPDSVQCLVIDDLYETVYNVSLDDFQATKSVSGPLLYNYTIHMTVKSTSVDSNAPVDYSGLPNDPLNRLVDAANIASSHQSASGRTYKVQSGDSLWTIAQMYYGDGSQYTKIAKANGIMPPYTIYAGQILSIP